MIISERAKAIILYLLQASDFLNISEIAKHLHVTERTIYREMPEIEAIMAHCSLQLHKVTGKGVQIYGTLAGIKKLDTMLEESTDQLNYTSKERGDLLMIHLLQEDDYIKTQALSLDFHMSPQTIRNDVHELKTRYESDGLKFLLKKGEGLQIKGKEHAKRHMLSSILLKNIPLDTFYRWMHTEDNMRDPYLTCMDHFGYTQVMRTLYVQVERLFAKKRIAISDKEFEEFLIMLCICVKRHDYGDCEEFGFIGHIYCPAHEVYGEIRELLIEHFQLALRKEEENYLRWIINLYTKRSLHQKSGEPSLLEQLDFTSELIHKVEERFHFPFSEDTQLLENMLMHMNMALERILCGMPVNNPLNEEIYEMQPKLYEIVKESFLETFQSIAKYVPEDEIGYIVIYFLAAMESIQRQPISALVICSSGMGSSKMLRNRLEREFSELHVVKIISLHKLEDEDLRNYDIILSTIELNLNNDKYLCVSPLLNEQDKEATKNYIQRMNKKRSAGR